MPVTMKLLQRLQETIGEEATSDLVTWVDQSSARSVAQIREVADLYSARFDARLAQLEAKLEQRLAEFRAEVRGEMARLEMRIETGLAALRAETAAQRSDLIKWMFIFWVGTIVPLAGLMVVLIRVWKP